MADDEAGGMTPRIGVAAGDVKEDDGDKVTHVNESRGGTTEVVLFGPETVDGVMIAEDGEHIDTDEAIEEEDEDDELEPGSGEVGDGTGSGLPSAQVGDDDDTGDGDADVDVDGDSVRDIKRLSYGTPAQLYYRSNRIQLTCKVRDKSYDVL